jgi:hypothetical protein
VPFQAHAVRQDEAHAQRAGRRDDADEAGLVFRSSFSTEQATTSEYALLRIELLRLQAFRPGVVGNAAVEGLSSLDVVQSVLLPFGDRCVAHHRLL